MEEKLRQKDTIIEKLRLKNSTIKAQIGKMEHMLAHKEEMGEVLHLVSEEPFIPSSGCALIPLLLAFALKVFLSWLVTLRQGLCSGGF
jgi:hypothetical protein